MRQWILLFLFSVLALSCDKKKSSPNATVSTFEVKATITTNNSSIQTDESVRLEVFHTAGVIEKVVWYFDSGAGETLLQSDISPVYTIDSFSSLNEGTYRVEVYQSGAVVASDTAVLSLDNSSSDEDDGGTVSANSSIKLTAQAVGIENNIYSVGTNVYLTTEHDYEFDSYKWSIDKGIGFEEIVGYNSASLALSPAALTDSGTYKVELIKDSISIVDATLLISIVELETSTFTTCASDPASCTDAIRIPNDGAVHNCPSGSFPTSCNGVEEQGCLYHEASDGFVCHDEGDGSGCYLYCHTVADSALEKSVLKTDGFMDLFKAIQFKPEDGQVSCDAGYIPTGCSGFEDQTCENPTEEKFKCVDNGGGDKEGCQLFCWQAADSENRYKSVKIDEDETGSCGTGYIPTGCSGEDEDYCRPEGDGVYKCVDHFWGSGCTLHCVGVQ